MKKLLLVGWLFLLGGVLISGCGGNGSSGPFITKVAAGYAHTIALTDSGLVYAWGLNDQGQLGNGTNNNSNVPVKVNFPAGVVIVEIAAGGSHNLAITDTHEIYAWGDNDHGQLGDSTKTDRSTPVKISGLNEIYVVSAGDSHSMAIQTGGFMWLWGNNDCYQLGVNNVTERLYPAKCDYVALSSGVLAIAAGWFHSLAIDNDHFIWAWGANGFGEVGGTGGGIRETPDTIKLSPTGGAVLLGHIIAAGGDFSLAVNNSVTSVWAWGRNGYGQIGNNTPGPPYQYEYPVQATDPTEIGYLTGVTAIAAGQNFTIAKTNATTLYGWGKNTRGQLAQGSTFPSSIYLPTLLTHLPAGSITGITAGGNHAALVTSNGKVYTWGMGSSGQLGNGSYGDGLIPGAVKW